MSWDEATIVVVDDDDIMRQLVRDILESVGVRADNIKSFPGGVEAQTFFEREPSMEALVVCDISMPNLGGFELYERVHDQSPGLKFVFISAFNLDRSQRRFLEREGLGLLVKPFTPNQLVTAVQNLAER